MTYIILNGTVYYVLEDGTIVPHDTLEKITVEIL